MRVNFYFLFWLCDWKFLDSCVWCVRTGCFCGHQFSCFNFNFIVYTISSVKGLCFISSHGYTKHIVISYLLMYIHGGMIYLWYFSSKSHSRKTLVGTHRIKQNNKQTKTQQSIVCFQLNFLIHSLTRSPTRPPARPLPPSLTHSLMLVTKIITFLILSHIYTYL